MPPGVHAASPELIRESNRDATWHQVPTQDFERERDLVTERLRHQHPLDHPGACLGALSRRATHPGAAPPVAAGDAPDVHHRRAVRVCFSNE
jgi:hypothetical protein